MLRTLGDSIDDYFGTDLVSKALAADGTLDGKSHSLEMLYSAVGKPFYEQMERVAGETIRQVVKYLPRVLASPGDATGREALGLATDLGAYAIMLGAPTGRT